MTLCPHINPLSCIVYLRNWRSLFIKTVYVCFGLICSFFLFLFSVSFWFDLFGSYNCIRCILLAFVIVVVCWVGAAYIRYLVFTCGFVRPSCVGNSYNIHIVYKIVYLACCLAKVPGISCYLLINLYTCMLLIDTHECCLHVGVSGVR
jgi:hypothetical protein